MPREDDTRIHSPEIAGLPDRRPGPSVSSPAVDEIRVAVGVLSDARGRILIAKRPESVPQGGLWEFPGGKVERGESVRDALHRELREELGIDVEELSPLIGIRHHYPEWSVVLKVFRVEKFSGTAFGSEGQEIRWVRDCELSRFEFPEANRPVISAIVLPGVWPILNDDFGDPEALRQRFLEWVDRGVRHLQIRCKRLSSARFATSVRPLCALARRLGVRIVLNTEPEIAARLGAAGVHLSARLLSRQRKRPLDRRYWVGASCHDPEELHEAQRLGFDYAFLSPVCKTSSHPGVEPLGWQRFASWVDRVNIPVYALGGMRLEDLQAAREYGGQGIAGIGAFAV